MHTSGLAKCLASRFAHGQCARSRGMPANKKKMARDVRVQHAEGMFINELTARDTHVEKVHEANALINQGHDTLVDVHSGQKLIIYGEFHVHQGIADGVDVVFIHEIGYLLTGACGW